MLNDKIISYYDSINPSFELVERTIEMSKENKKRVRISNKAIALLVAVLVLLLGVTGYATVNRIINDKKGIVEYQNESFSFDFSNADITPEKYSNKNARLIKELNKYGYDNIALPTAMLDETLEITNTINPFLRENGIMLEVKNSKIDYTLQMFNDMSLEEMNDFYGTGDENTICEVVEANGIDACVNIEGDDEFGYSAYIFYAVDDTLYCINFYADKNADTAREIAVDFIKAM